MHMKRTFIIGDVHGCHAELRQLVGQLAPKAGDRFVWAGDLEDKGPDSPGAIKFARELSTQFESVLVASNHGDKHIRYRKHLKLFREQGKAIPMKKVDEIARINEQLSDADIAFLDSAVLYHALPEFNSVVVHGGISPKVSFLPPIGDPALKKDKYQQFIRLRHVSPEGDMVSLGDETEKDSFWADVYDGRFGHVFFGHQAYHKAAEPVRFPHATAIDLGCVYGNKLCAAVLSEDGVRFAMVSAIKKHTHSFDE